MIPKIDINSVSYTKMYVQVAVFFIAIAITIIACQKRLTSKRLPQSIARIPSDIQAHLNSQPSKIRPLLKKAFQIKKLVENTFFVFTHAQSQQWSVINDFFLELHKQAKPCHQLFIKNQTLDSVRKEVESKSICDHNYRGQLLSVDGYMWNEDKSESAIDFLKTNFNTSSPSLSNIMDELQRFLNYKHYDQITEIAQKVYALAKRKQLEDNVGALYVIMVEKDSPVFYRSHAFGNMCHCFYDNPSKVLEDLQNDRRRRCLSEFLRNPQYRIFLDPQHNIRSVRLDTLSKKTKQFYQREVQALVKEVHDLKAS